MAERGWHREPCGSWLELPWSPACWVRGITSRHSSGRVDTLSEVWPSRTGEWPLSGQRACNSNYHPQAKSDFADRSLGTSTGKITKEEEGCL